MLGEISMTPLKGGRVIGFGERERENMTRQMEGSGNFQSVQPSIYEKDITFCKGMLRRLRMLQTVVCKRK